MKAEIVIPDGYERIPIGEKRVLGGKWLRVDEWVDYDEFDLNAFPTVRICDSLCIRPIPKEPVYVPFDASNVPTNAWWQDNVDIIDGLGFKITGVHPRLVYINTDEVEQITYEDLLRGWVYSVSPNPVGPWHKGGLLKEDGK